jgi:serine/threonine-protein kinase RsbW
MSGGLRSADPLPRPQADAPAHPIPALSSWARAFPGVPRQVGLARRFVSALLEGSPLRDDAVIVISELFTNALQHTDSGQPGGLVVVQVSRWRQGVRIAVTDQGSDRCPVIRDTGPASRDEIAGVSATRVFTDWLAQDDADAIPADCGHGLYMVSCLAERLDWHDDARGRTVHAVLGHLPAGSARPRHELEPTEGAELLRGHEAAPDRAQAARQPDVAFRPA